ncbi:MAG TPA: winged helix-turn-helix domain-containing protein [Spirochaetota bacterium]|nr:winged helix-turn-helix domain-containing protein [Spirochaetota bacterium]HPP05336.1 winged helix-turn-helix domain-containing protein [Spirochaetota bacterium]
MFRTLKFACKYVKERFNINYTEEGMVITLKRLGFRYKKPVIIPGKIPDVETQKKFTGQAKDILNNLKEKEAAYFWDGAGMVHNVKLDYGWIKKGQSKIVKTNTGREKMNIYQKVFKS